MPGTVTLIEDFTAADGTNPPNANWIRSGWNEGGAGSNLFVQSNSVWAAGVGEYSECYDQRGSTPADCGRCVTVVGSPVDGDNLDIHLRMVNADQVSTRDAYLGQWIKRDADDEFLIYRHDNGVYTQLAAVSSGFNLAVTDLFEFQSVGDEHKTHISDDGGDTWTEVIGATDSTYASGGPASLGVFRRGARADDWSDVDVSSGPVLGSFSLTGTVTLDTAGNVRRYGSSSLTATVAADTTGHRRAKGAVTLTETVSTDTEGERTAKGAFSLTKTVSTDIEGARTAKGALSLTETINIDTEGVGTGNLKLGSASLTATVSIATAGNRTAYGAVSLTETVTASTAGEKSARGAFALTLTVNITTDGGIPVTFFPVGTTGRIARPIAGRIARPLAGRIQT